VRRNELALAIGAILAENLSLAKGIISSIESAINSIYTKMKDKKYNLLYLSGSFCI
jgi:hypothetical protein